MSSASRSGASSSVVTHGKQTPHSSLNHSNEVLMIAAHSPMTSGPNSQSESLGASISDWSSEPASELSDNYTLNSKTNNKKSSSGKSNGTISGTSTPTKFSNGANSRLPIPKK